MTKDPKTLQERAKVTGTNTWSDGFPRDNILFLSL